MTETNYSPLTFYLIEKGEASVAFGAYFNVLRVLHLEKDILKLAANDELGEAARPGFIVSAGPVFPGIVSIARSVCLSVRGEICSLPRTFQSLSGSR